MSITARTVNKYTALWLLMVLISSFLYASSARAADPFSIMPVERPADIKLLPATAWPPPEGDRGQLLLKYAYLRGIVDALQYVELAPDTPGETLKALKGMDLNQLAAAVDRYYLTTPKARDLPPAAVVLRVLPGLKTAKTRP